MAIPTTMADLSTTANSNSPSGSENPGQGDDFLRAIQAILRTTNAKGADIASSTTTDIGAATGEFVDVTGTTTITGLGTIASGIRRVVRFTGILILTHNGTSLILPSSANITTQAGDIAQFRSLGSGNWVCTDYMRKDGTPLIISVTSAQIQGQTFTAFTTGGTSTAYTLTPTPAITANTTNQRFNVTLNAAPGASPTLSVSGQTAKNFKYYDNNGAKQFINSAVAPSGWNSDVIYDGTDWIMQSVSKSSASTVRLNTANGYGSTNTKIRRFTNTVTNQGTDITYADSATLGSSFTINTTGVYAISYCESFSAGNTFGISIDSAQLTTDIQSITVANILSIAQTPSANVSTACATTVFVSSGSVIRAHGSGQAVGTQPVLFTITKVN